MDKELIVKKSINIYATPDVIWHALTDRKTVKKYFFGTEAISDWKVGRKILSGQGKNSGSGTWKNASILLLEWVFRAG